MNLLKSTGFFISNKHNQIGSIEYKHNILQTTANVLCWTRTCIHITWEVKESGWEIKYKYKFSVKANKCKFDDNSDNYILYKLHIFTRENNMLSSQMKRSPLFLRLFRWCLYNKQNITCTLVDRNFIFLCLTRDIEFMFLGKIRN